jgi:hypothetical protein
MLYCIGLACISVVMSILTPLYTCTRTTKPTVRFFRPTESLTEHSAQSDSNATQGLPSLCTNFGVRSSPYGPLCAVRPSMQLAHPCFARSRIPFSRRVYHGAPRIRCAKQRDGLPIRQWWCRLQPLPLYVLFPSQNPPLEKGATSYHRYCGGMAVK